MCGVLGINGLVTLGQGKVLLQMLTHRGQDASGIAWVENKTSSIKVIKKDSYPDLLDLEENRETSLLLGSTRYPTFGTRTDSSNIEKYAQPFTIKTKYGILVVVHNGNITNIHCITNKEYESDTEFIVEFLGDLINVHSGDLKTAVENFMQKVDGSYSIIGALNELQFTFRDPRGIRPLVIGNNKDMTVISSESVVLQNLGILEIHDIKPGELLIFTNEEITKCQIMTKDHAHCMFEYVYFANPCSILENRLVYDVRLDLGKELGYRIKDLNLDIDFVVPVPDTSRPASQGLSEVLKIPVRESIIKNRYLQRTFIMKSKKERTKVAKSKYLYTTEYIKDKNILLVDDSIVRGLTSQKIVKDLRNLGAKKVYFAVTCPAIRFACYYGIDFPTDEELIASGHTIEEIKDVLDVDGVYYQSIDSLKTAIGFSDLCTACLSGSYPTPYAQEIRIKYLNGELKGRSHYEEV
ncbi:MAG: amidophosphoribosyltransferase [Candidatus Heimdallarchaeota archaeon]|nr:amidophosphoribosyltransferase [Candidatus Heimdallarchaeota archaeon]